ncbi:terpene synthase family protein [Chryseobacterium populi]|uniref:Terpene synthase n=1 Tax=Chryseobacterium populi TaxID=1144316 RepID=J2KE11_9FLAO|nr:hypothetical protein [Chryseobacterium populi]EJL71408.1 terpene synthase family protein [Chryseobacterium populi]
MKPEDFDPKKYLPLGYYPWPDLINKHVEEMEPHEAHWIETDFSFVSEKLQEKYKKIALYNVVSRMQPYHTREQLLACTRLLFWHTFIDDQYEHSPVSELKKIRERMVAIMQGDQVRSDENGVFQQIAISRDELNAFAPQEWMQRLINDMDEYIHFGVEEEIYYREHNKLPTFANYSLFREYSIGMYPHYTLVEIGLDFPINAALLRHPVVQRARHLASRITIWENDIHSIRKDLYTERETLNAAFVLQKEHGISLEEAIEEMMRIHDADVAEMVSLQNNLDGFSPEDQAIIKEYIFRMGVAIQGINSFYILQPQRYVTVGGFSWPDTEPLKLRENFEKI